MPPRPFRRLFSLPWRSRASIRDEAAAEVEEHIALHAARLVAEGVPPADARRKAEQEFGDRRATLDYIEAVDTTAERRIRVSEWLDDLRSDLRAALRSIRLHPGYAALVALTLALGVGANTAVFDVVSAVLLKALPYRDADQLVAIDELNVPAARLYSDVAAAEYLDWTTASRSLAGVAAAGQRSLTFAEGATPEQVPGRRVSANFLDVMGVTPALGRGFHAGEDRGVNRLIVLTDGLWRRMYGADSSIVGRQVRLSGDLYTVVGVLRADFLFPGARPQFFIPIDFTAAMNDINRARAFHFTHAFGRLRPGATTADARAELTTIARRAERQFPNQSTGHLVSVRPLRDALFGGVRPTMLLLAGAAAFVLLIACANVANLALARGIARRRETAVRIALGANRGRVVRQMLTESTLLALIGGAAGTAVAYVATPALIALYPQALPPGFVVHVDTRVLAFAVGISALSAIGFGLFPALSSTRPELTPTLRDGPRGSTAGASSSRARAVLVVAQIMLTTVLLVGAGLLVRTLARLQSVDLGFASTQLVAVPINLPGAKYSTRETITSFWTTFLERVRREPGFANASLAGAAPLFGGSGAGLAIQGRETGGQLPDIRYGVAMDGYFTTLSVPLRAGREFQPDDRTSASRAVVINEAAAKQFWPGQDPIGANVRLGPNPAEPWSRVVGVVADFRNETIDAEPAPLAITFGMQDVWSSMTLVVRTPEPATKVHSTVANIVRDLDPSLAVQTALSIDDAVRQTSAPRRFASSLLGVFAIVAFAVAIVGLYGVIAYGIATRQHEIGVRMALGARPGQVVQMVIREGAALATCGLALGVIAAASLTRFLSALLFGIKALDPVTFMSVVGGLLVAAIVAAWIPARRAASLDPSSALRADG